MKNIVAIRNLVQFYQKHPDAKSSLETWLPVTKHATWQKPFKDFADADPVKNNRVVFNIAKNKYRLIVQISYPR